MRAPVAVESVAAIGVPAPGGTECTLLRDGDTVAFGRGADCGVRFAFAPEADPGVPRIAGRFLVIGGRVIVESNDGRGHRSLEILSDRCPPRLVGGGDAYSPADSTYAVVVHGDRQAWRLHVSVRGRRLPLAGPADDIPPTGDFLIELTELQRKVAIAYLEPLRRGRLEPATHREVAEALNYHPNSVREALYTVWEKLFTAGIPMPDVSDKRVAVTEALRLHRLLEDV